MLESSYREEVQNVDEYRIFLAAWESMLNTQKQDGTFVPNRDVPNAIVEAIKEYHALVNGERITV
jgi:hypothetical protein